MPHILPQSFYQSTDVVTLAQQLLGKVIVTNIDGIQSSGIITETEAYKAPEDKASHAYNNRRTKRTEIMFGSAGRAYVYLCYGIHHLFNVVTGPEDHAHAVLIRAIEPLDNIEAIMERRRINGLKPQLTAGPGVLSKALGINTNHTGTILFDPKSPIQIWDGETPTDIVHSKRIGIDYAEEWKDKLWRFYIKDSQWISKK